MATSTTTTTPTLQTAPSPSSQHHDDTTAAASSQAHQFGRMVELNVGGEVFATTIGTLTRNGSDRNYFHNMLIEPGFEPTLDRNGRYFIDRDGQLFRPILHYLRTGEWWCPASLPERLVLAEARFYCIEPTVYSSLSDSSLRDLQAAAIASRHQEFLAQHSETCRVGKEFILAEFEQQANRGKDIKTPVVLPSIETITEWALLMGYRQDKQRAIENLQHLLRKAKRVTFNDAIHMAVSQPEAWRALRWDLLANHSISIARVKYFLFRTSDNETFSFTTEPAQCEGCPRKKGYGIIWAGSGGST